MRTVLLVGGLTSALSGVAGCLSEQSFEMAPEDSRVVAFDKPNAPEGMTARRWLRNAHTRLADLLPGQPSNVLFIDDLVGDDGRPVDVFQHFGVRREGLRTLLGNLDGLRCTGQAASRSNCIDHPAPSWPGFDDVWIPVEGRLSLSARLGFARRQGEVVQADCIVILPGFLGDNAVKRTKDLALFLHQSGFHVLALELRGHGRTQAKYPNVSYTYGVKETDDLMLVSDWLESQPGVRRTGLVGFCWSANLALLAGWFDGRSAHDPSITPTIAANLVTKPDRRRFTAGIMAFSTIPQWERLTEALKTPRAYLEDPVYAAIQATVQDRMTRKGFPHPDGDLGRLIQLEYDECGVKLPNGSEEGFRFLRLVPHEGHPAFPKLESVRTPLVIVHAANDPLSPAQDVADMLRPVKDPTVAAIFLPSGGHVGFVAYAKQYYYSLIASFFDPVAGAAAQSGGRVHLAHRSGAATRAALNLESVAAQKRPQQCLAPSIARLSDSF